MDKLSFAPFVDFPLTGVVLAAFLWHFNRWARRNDIDTSINLASRLPKARLRVVALHVCILIACWYFNVAVWSILGIIFCIGLAAIFLITGDVDGAGFGLWSAACMIREWAFGFPQLILHPVVHPDCNGSHGFPTDDLVGKTGITISPIRPTGDAEIEGTKYSVASDDGQWIDAGIPIRVKTWRNGRPCIGRVDPQ
jgi:hypothetical protein